jgi:hypothetical protein
MSLAVYEEVSPGIYEAFSINGAQTNPVTTVHDGKKGTIEEKKLYVRADDAHAYTLIQVKPKSLTIDSDIGSGSNPGSSGWGIKLFAGENQPSQAEWEAMDYGATIDVANISNSSTYRPFWTRVHSPSGIRVSNKTNIALYLKYLDTP